MERKREREMETNERKDREILSGKKFVGSRKK